MAWRIGIENSEVAFDGEANESVLDAALKARVGLPYSCRKGVCGSCAGAVTQGEVRPLVDGTAIVNEACLPGQVLYCMCAAASDLVLRPQAWQRIDPGVRKRLTARVYRNQAVAPDVALLHLRLPAGQRARFKAGQYLQLTLDDGSTRSYSMANAPNENDGVMLHIRKVPHGRFSGQVQKLAAGDTLQIELPFGNAFPPDDSGDAPLLLVAGGTGFAPIKSVLDDLMKKRSTRRITLVWGARDAAGLYLVSAVEKWLRYWPGFRFIAALESGAAQMVGETFAGRVDRAVVHHCPDLSDHLLYCCGSPTMVVAVRAAAVGHCGLPVAAFHADAFVPGPASAPPAT